MDTVRAMNAFTIVLFALLAATGTLAEQSNGTSPVSETSSPAAAAAANVHSVSAKIAVAPDTTKPVQVQLFYEALCKDSVDFVNIQLLPAYEVFSKFIDITYNPFSQGKVEKDANGNATYKCPREHECDADRVHACAIAHINDAEKLLKFVNCSLVEGFKTKSVPIETCGSNISLDNDIVKKISACFTGDEGYSYLSDYADKAKAANVTAVPKIIVNKVYSDETQKLAQENFKQVVCREIPAEHRPSECKSSDSGSSTIVVGVLPLLVGMYYIIKSML